MQEAIGVKSPTVSLDTSFPAFQQVMGPAGHGWARQLPDARPGRDRGKIDMTAKLVAVAYYLVETKHEDELVKLISFNLYALAGAGFLFV